MAKQRTKANRIDEPDLHAIALEHCLANENVELVPTAFPRLDSISSAFFYQFLPIPDEPGSEPEYVYVKSPEEYGLTGNASARYRVFVTLWNNTWEARGARISLQPPREIPKQLRWVTEANMNLRLVWRGASHSYDPYAPLYHLLPRATLQRFGLPALRRGIWPAFTENHLLSHIIPKDFDLKFEKALMYHLWPHLGARGAPSCFSRSDPIKTLSHNLDYWMPYVDLVAQKRARALGRVKLEDGKQEALYHAHKKDMPSGVILERPLFGGQIWCGESDALHATCELIEIADKRGNLRAILDAVRSHRIADDFSPRWSFEREDFDRKIYSKRNKVKVAFVELDDTIPVLGPQSEVHENLLWEDFFALLDTKERRIAVCLRNGETRLGNIAKTLGYANHSAISKRLARIRRSLMNFLARH